MASRRMCETYGTWSGAGHYNPEALRQQLNATPADVVCTPKPQRRVLNPINSPGGIAREHGGR